MPTTSGDPEHSGEPPPAPAGPMRWRRVFPGDQPQLAVVRRWLSSLLPVCAARDDVICVATELGTNAVLHTDSGRGGWFAVEVTWYGPVLRVAVADCGGAGAPRVVDGAAGEHGRGLAVVRELAVQSGYHGDRHGRLVWADIAWDQVWSQAQEEALSAGPPQPGRLAGSGSWQEEPASLSA